MTLTIAEASVPTLIARVANDLQQFILKTLAQQDRFTWVLSGGNTPKQLFELLTREPYRSTIPWQRLWIFWGDERPVPPTDSQSNFHMAQQTLLASVPIPSGQIFRIKGELPPVDAALEYEAQLRSVFGKETAFPVFDLILLGMGPDGHTASLFPNTSALNVKDRWVIENPVKSLNTTRLTFTFPVLNNAKEVWFLATGKEKADAYAHVRKSPNPQYPASLVAPVPGVLRWYVDEAVSS